MGGRSAIAARAKVPGSFASWLYLCCFANFLNFSLERRVHPWRGWSRSAIGDLAQLRVQIDHPPQPRFAALSRRDLYVMPCAAEAFAGMVLGRSRRLHFTLADGTEFHLPRSRISPRQLARALVALGPSQQRIADPAARQARTRVSRRPHRYASSSSENSSRRRAVADARIRLHANS
jgi:hypothetical protein